MLTNLQRHFLLVTGDTPKQPLSHRHFCQHLISAKLRLAYLNKGAGRLQFNVIPRASLASYPGPNCMFKIIKSRFQN